MTTSLIQVPFHGDVIEATQQDDEILVPLRRPCKSLGIDYSDQLKKLKNKAWASMVRITMLDAAGRQFEMICLPQKVFPMWLATIEVSRVREEIRGKLALYQKEAAQVLASYFLPQSGTPPVKEVSQANPLDALQLMLDALRSQDQRLTGVEARVGAIEQVRTEAVARLETIERSTTSPPPLSTRDRVNQLVRAYAKATTTEHQLVWRRLYHELFYRCSFNAQLRARNAGKLALDCVEESGLMDDLYAVASEILKF